MKNDYGTVTHNGNIYTLLQAPYCSNYGTDGAVRYYAAAEDADGNQYKIVWETTETWDMACELEKLTVDMEYAKKDHRTIADDDKQRYWKLNEMILCSVEDESNACDWDNPVEVREI